MWVDCVIASKKKGAVFELPCNTNISEDQDGFIACDGGASYEVWAKTGGKPNGEATITTCATVQDELQCSTENTVQTRTRGKSIFTWETTRIALFSGDTEDWFWNYANNGLRLLQLRFYDVN